MSTFSIGIVIERPPDEVFAYLRDYANQKIWQAENLIELSVEPSEPIKVGTKVHKVRQTPGGKEKFTMEISRIDLSARQWTEDTISGSLQGTKAVWTVQPEGKASRVSHTIEFQAAGFKKLLLPIIRKSARKDFESEFAKLKEILESAH